MSGSPGREHYSRDAGERNGAARSLRDDTLLVALALALVAVSFVSVAHEKVDLRDEGYLWYGAIAVAKGQIPMRDFESYDPARYYWVAAFMALLDRGIVPLRAACSAFHFPGVLCGLLALRRLTRAWSVLVPAGALLTLWLFPPFMLNHTVALVGVWVAVLLLERPSAARHVLAGVYVGLAAFVGRNLGLYALVSFTALVALAWWKVERDDAVGRACAFGAGVALGYSPILFMMAFVPGFFAIYVAALRAIVESGTTNVALAVRWPWQATSVFEASVALFFVVVPLFYALAAAWLVRATPAAVRRHRVLVAATVVGIPYVHYALSRADTQHLAMGIHPFLIGTFAVAAAVAHRSRPLAVGVVAGLFAVSLVAGATMSPMFIRAMAEPGRYVPLQLGRWSVWMPWYQADFIRGAIRFNATMVRPDEGFLIAPHVGPGLYSILNRDSPVWQIYFVQPQPESWQRRMIDELERNRVDWALLEDVRTDGREELRFRHTHRLLWEYIVREFDPVPVDGLPEDFTLYRRRGAAGVPG